MVIKNKRGVSMSIELMIVIIISVVVLLAVIWYVTGGFKNLGGITDAFSPGMNAILIGKCNGYCAVMQGKSGGAISATIDVSSAVYSYCSEIYDFRDDDGEENPMTCKAASGIKGLGISDCRCSV